MEKKELIEKLNELATKCEVYAATPFKIDGDPSDWHMEADGLLLKYIHDDDITTAFNAIERWYE